ncbi:MAG: hypothetical protein GXO76_11995 [Calditrichaeota bacterium]|nr:hypothetical protein [Calditrichota bacterium]
MKKTVFIWIVIVLFFGINQAYSQPKVGEILGSRGKGVVIKLGQKDHIQNNQVFDIYRDVIKNGKRKRIKIGRVLVIKAYENISVAKIQSLKKGIVIRKGDIAVRVPPSFFSDYFAKGNLQFSGSVGMAKLYLTDFNRSFVAYASQNLVNAKEKKIHSGTLFRGRLKARLPHRLTAILEGEYLSTSTALNAVNQNRVAVALKRVLETWSGSVGLAYSLWQTQRWELFTGAKVGLLKSDIKFLNAFGNGSYRNSYFEEWNTSSGLFAGLSYSPTHLFSVTLEGGYDARNLGHLSGYSYQNGVKLEHVIARAPDNHAITTDLSGFSTTLGMSVRF